MKVSFFLGRFPLVHLVRFFNTSLTCCPVPPRSTYLFKKKTQNITFLSHLTKFRVVPTHVILHIFKVCLDDFTGVNVENLALLLEGCGRFLLRSEETRERFPTARVETDRISDVMAARLAICLLGHVLYLMSQIPL